MNENAKKIIFRTIPARLVKKEKLDAKKFERNVNVVAECAYAHFFSLPTKIRALAYGSFQKRTQGRKPA